MKPVWTLALLALPLTLGCDGIVGLERPAEGDLEGGAPQDGPVDARTEDAPVDTYPAGTAADASVAMPDTGAAPLARWPLLDGGVVEGLAFGYSLNTLYILQTDETAGTGIALYYASLDSAPKLRWSGAGYGVSLAGLCPVTPYSVYFGDSGGTTNEIRVIDTLADQQQALATPEVVVDIAGALPGSQLGPIIGLACDAEALFWTQTVDGTTALLRHDFADGGAPVSVVWSAATGDALNQVAIDSSYVYTVGSAGGTVYAIPRDTTEAGTAAASPIATSAVPTAPLVTSLGGVYYVRGSAFTQMGDLYFAYPTGDAGAPTYTLGLPVQTFAFAGSTLLVGTGPNVDYVAQTSGGAQPLVGTPGSSPITVVAGTTGLGAYANAQIIGMSAVP